MPLLPVMLRITEVTPAVARPWASVVRNRIWIAVTGVGIPTTWYCSVRVFRTVPGAYDASGVEPL